MFSTPPTFLLAFAAVLFGIEPDTACSLTGKVDAIPSDHVVALDILSGSEAGTLVPCPNGHAMFSVAADVKTPKVGSCLRAVVYPNTKKAGELPELTGLRSCSDQG